MMDVKTFQQLREIVYRNSGIKLNDTKVAMVSSRIAKRMRVLKIDNHSEYLHYLVKDKTGDEITKFLDVISTNVTSFFREPEHFNLLEKVVAEAVAAGQTRIRIWCAAASTGEEPYTIAMVCRQAAADRPIDLRILATDISTKVLGEAQEGVYLPEKLKTVPRPLINKYFTQKTVAGEHLYDISDQLKKMIVFRRLNLAKPPFPMKGPLDFVFCRNVMIYFDNIVRSGLVSEIYRLLKPGGYLITGHSESLTSIENKFECLKPSVFQK